MNNIIDFLILALLVVIIIALREIANNLKLYPTSYPVKIFAVDRFGSVCLIVGLQLISPIGKPHYHIAEYLNLDRDPIMGKPGIAICQLNEFQAIFAHEPSSEEIEEVFEVIKEETNE